MQNQIYPQYQMPYGAYPPYQAQYCQPVSYAPVSCPNSPTSSVGAVNIQIFNPTANPQPQQGFYANSPMQYPYNYNNMMMPYPSNGYNMIDPSGMNNSMNMNQTMNGVAGQADGDKGAKTEKDKEKEKQKVALTDDYVKTLENYLNSQDKKVRLMGAKELFNRFKEDETRKDDAALTALLNKTLQDPAETVKFVALSALDAGYATGNDETAAILTDMQKSNSSYGEDASMATNVLLKMSGYKANSDAMNMPENAHLRNNSKNNAVADNQMTMPQPALQQSMQYNAQPVMQQNMQFNPNNGMMMNQTQMPMINGMQAA